MPIFPVRPVPRVIFTTVRAYMGGMTIREIAEQEGTNTNTTFNEANRCLLNRYLRSKR